MLTLIEKAYGLVSGLLRVAAASVLSVLIVPPVALAVVAGTLVYGPVPGGQLPDERPSVQAFPSVVLDAKGREIGMFRGYDRTAKIQAEDIPDVIKEAVVSIEDRRFYTHNGVDLEGIARAARTNLEAGGVIQGGSTITQQYVKNVYLSGEKTIERKVEEALLAVEVERRMTKDEILSAYLMTVYFGDGAYGIGAAAEVYFDKHVSELDISEAATLAGLLRAPTSLSPRNDVEAAEGRRQLVVSAMHELGYISDEDFEREIVRTLWLPSESRQPGPYVTLVAERPPKGAYEHPYFVDWVENELVAEFGPDLLYKGGLTIETTIDPNLQRAAARATEKRLENTEYPVDMSLVSIDPSTGHVVAMVGGRDYDYSQVNLATGGTTGFQPGSSFKPIVMAAAFELGLNPETLYPAPATWTVPSCSGQCTVSNYDHTSRGNLSLRDSMRLSVNTVFAQLILDVTVRDTVELANKLGLDRLDPERAYGASLSLGAAESSTLEMASAYGTFANRGVRVKPTGILRVIDQDGNVLIDNRRPSGERVLKTSTADNVTDVLVDVVERGTGTRAKLDRPAAGKTGTSQEYRAAWFVGYTPQYTTAVWMGHADALKPLRGVNGVARVTGGSHPAIAWREFMETAHQGLEPQEFAVPEEILVPAGGTPQDLIAQVAREETVAAPKERPAALSANCGGSPCEKHQIPVSPQLPPPEQPVIVPPATTPSTSALPPTNPTIPANPAPAAPEGATGGLANQGSANQADRDT